MSETEKILKLPKNATRLENQSLYGNGNACQIIQSHIDNFFKTCDGES